MPSRSPEPPPASRQRRHQGDRLSGALQTLGADLVRFPSTSFSPAVRTDATLVIADTVLCAFVAGGGGGGGARDRRGVRSWAATSSSHRSAATDRSAVRTNAVQAHRLELDPVHFITRGHPGVVMVPALSALVDRGLLTRSEAFGCLVAGTEVMALLGQAWGPALSRAGVHATAYLAPIALSAAVAAVRERDAAAVCGALFAAAVLGAGVTAGFGTDLKARQVARAAELVVELAEDPPQPAPSSAWVAELRRRFGAPQADWITDEEPALGRRFVVDQVPSLFKVLPACAFFAEPLAHLAAIAATLPVSDIVELRIDVPREAVAANAGGLPPSSDQVPFSLEYLVACLLVAGRAADFRGRAWRQCPTVGRLVPRVSVGTASGELTDIEATLAGSIRVTTREAVAEHPVAYAARPDRFSAAGLRHKWDALAVDLGGDRVRDAVTCLLDDLGSSDQCQGRGWLPSFFELCREAPH